MKGRGFNPKGRMRGYDSGSQSSNGSTVEEVPIGIVTDKSMRLHIRNVPLYALEKDGANALRDEFAAFGAIDRYHLFTDLAGHFNGQGMCTFTNAVDARKAREGLNKKVLDDGTLLIVSEAKEHGAVLAKTIQERERKKSAADEPWQHDLFNPNDQTPDGLGPWLGTVESGRNSRGDDSGWSRANGGRGSRARGRGRGRGRGSRAFESTNEGERDLHVGLPLPRSKQQQQKDGDSILEGNGGDVVSAPVAEAVTEETFNY